MKLLMIVAASAMSAVLVLPTVTQAQTEQLHAQVSAAVGATSNAQLNA